MANTSPGLYSRTDTPPERIKRSPREAIELQVLQNERLADISSRRCEGLARQVNTILTSVIPANSTTMAVAIEAAKLLSEWTTHKERVSLYTNQNRALRHILETTIP